MITSIKNQKVRFARALRDNRKHRRKEKAFFIEGVHAMSAALRNGWTFHYVFYCPETSLTQWAQSFILDIPEEKRIPVNTYVQAQLSERSSPSEIMGIVAQPPNHLDRIPLREDLLVLILDRPRSPGNLGSAIRSAEALGAQGVLITGHAADVYDPKTVRATMGALFEVPVVIVHSNEILQSWLSQVRGSLGDLQVVATSAHAEKTVYEHDFTGPTVIIIGNETAGISFYYRELCTGFLSIPMRGAATSLNASVAASVFLYEASRQRITAAGKACNECSVN